MIARHRPLIVAIVTLAILDSAGIIAMITSPDLTARAVARSNPGRRTVGIDAIEAANTLAGTSALA